MGGATLVEGSPRRNATRPWGAVDGIVHPGAGWSQPFRGPMFVCRHCGAAVTFSEPLPRDAECAVCGRDLRACIHCRHYDPAMNNSCRETEAEPVIEKE